MSGKGAQLQRSPLDTVESFNKVSRCCAKIVRIACRVSRLRQFSAVVRKNLLLQTRASKAWYTFRLTGWAALLLEIAVPGIFFALTCIPKIYLNPVEVPRQLTPPYALDATKWALDYDGEARAHTLLLCHIIGDSLLCSSGLTLSVEQKQLKSVWVCLPVNSRISPEHL